MVHPYLRRRQGEEPITYAHPDLRPILERTMGVPIFQEQVMAMAIAVGGFTAGEADQLRRAIGSWRKRSRLEPILDKLEQGLASHGVPAAYAEQILAQIKGFGEYGFPESHAASFAHLVYVSAWLKRHYPAVFTTALINSQPMGFYSSRALLADARRHQVEILPIDVTHSHWDCTLQTPSEACSSPVERDSIPRPAIRLGLRLLKGFAHKHAHALFSPCTRYLRAQHRGVLPRSVEKKRAFNRPSAGRVRYRSHIFHVVPNGPM